MNAAKHHVTIKGVKDGLVFILNDNCSFADLTAELKHKLEKTHRNILTGPIIHIHLRFGQRVLSEEQREVILGIISQCGNLVVKSMQLPEYSLTGRLQDGSNIVTKQGIVRSGETVTHEGNLLFLGNVNPGGSIVCSGDIYIMGSLRGMAHAGSNGNDQAIISAAHLRPTQLRIADIISRPPDEWGFEEAFMEFAYIRGGNMEIDKIQHISRIRSETSV